MEVESVTKILEEASEGQEIILESEDIDGDGEVEEIIEIVEEIEEIEENEEEVIERIEEAEQEENVTAQEPAPQKSNGALKEVECVNKKIIYASALLNNESIQDKPNNAYHYDASADWGDEEYEQDEQSNEMHHGENEGANNSQDYEHYTRYNNGVNSEGLEDSQEASRDNSQMNYEQNVVQANSTTGDDDSQQEIIQNSDNNLIYTVLGSKKQGQEIRESNVDFVEVQRYRDAELPDDGTIYYAVNEDGTYVQAVEDGQQYQYVNEVPVEENNQEWGDSNQVEENEQELAEQEQIYLHEDENGQLYFKNEHGELQPVYQTPDGNYAIAETSNDGQETQNAENEVQEEEHLDSENYVLPDLDLQQFTKNAKKNDMDDDDTVTISLIISEDENGQKRTQVIIPSPAPIKCKPCNKVFKTSLQLLKHNRLKHASEEDITTRNFPCDLCPKRFTDQNSLARHRKLHTEDRPFQCLECQKTFPTANILRKHLSTHNPDSHPLPCIYCGRRFLDKASLMAHEQSHLAAEKRNHVCDICQKCFINSTDLNIHKKNHDPDRKYDCEVCGREFNRLNNLQRHMMVHQQKGANEEILSCNVCGITYKFSSSLTRHMVTTHMNPEKLRQQAEEQRRKRENNYRRYLENRKTYETQIPTKRPYRRSTGSRLMDDEDDEEMDE